MVEVNCATCSKPLLRHPYQLKAYAKAFCDNECQGKFQQGKELVPRDATTYWCARCKSDRPAEEFVWETYKGKTRRRGYCARCRKEARDEYHATHKKQAAEQHAMWRQRSQTDNWDGLLWVFKRRLGSYRRQNRSDGLAPPDFDADWLFQLYKKQAGRCYYTGLPMTWATVGSGKGAFTRETVTLDRKTPAKGYFKSNVVLCVHGVNWMKSDRTEADFYETCRLVLAHRGLI